MATTIANLAALVYVETNRPDLISETYNAVLASITKMHCLDYFPRDIVTSKIVFDSSAYIQELDTTILPRWRAWKAIRKWDPTYINYQSNPNNSLPLISNSLGFSANPSQALAFFNMIDLDDILDGYETEKVNVCYQAGTTLYMKSSTTFQQAFAFFYQYPNLDPTNSYANFSSWIADNHPYTIVYDAASAVLQKIGMTDAARKYDNPTNGLVKDQMEALVKTGLLAKGY